MPDLHILPTPEEAAREAAKLVVNLATERVQSRGRFTIALAGGSTPRLLYRMLASSPFAEDAQWDRWHLFWGDERCVSPDHPDSNYRMAREALLNSVPVQEDQVHRIRGELPPAVAAEQYESLLHRQLDTDLPAFDLVLLGVGED
ncbi:MAG: 6-phosphogluconolactonase, partial [Chloroflexi bacterium]|nr:6-phosphogluconolactonase [Chloroflexota bacterium]